MRTALRLSASPRRAASGAASGLLEYYSVRDWSTASIRGVDQRMELSKIRAPSTPAPRPIWHDGISRPSAHRPWRGPEPQRFPARNETYFLAR
eukprot:6669578-Prymnesium_polylepis.1